jgi:hypothetical protein
MYTNEGLKGLWRGGVPTAQRAAVIAGVQVSLYFFYGPPQVPHQLFYINVFYANFLWRWN